MRRGGVGLGWRRWRGVTSIHPHKHTHKQWIHLGVQTLTCLSGKVLHGTVSTVTGEIDFEAQEDGTISHNM